MDLFETNVLSHFLFDNKNTKKNQYNFEENLKKD